MQPSSIEDTTTTEETSYDIDKFIAQLYECKPLNEKEVKFLI